jgi:pimeloyl-ACP methyl ester carboxylesterase
MAPYRFITGMTELRRQFVATNGIRLHFAEQGAGPLVLLCHGFPECWYSWRHQLPALANAGFHAVAPDMRGYGQTDRPDEVDQFTIFHLVGDMVGLLDVLGAEQAVIVGHDWGATVAWHAALIRPDRFRAVVALSVPFWPRGLARPMTVVPQTENAVFYWLYFQTPGVAEAELERDVRLTIRRILHSASGEAARDGAGGAPDGIGMVSRYGGFLSGMVDPSSLPPWLNETDIDYFAGEFARTGFRGPLNWYRNIDRNWELLAPFTGASVTVPALYVTGEHDPVNAFPRMDRLRPNLRKAVPQLRRTLILPGCGHWTQQERPEEVTAAMIEFLKSV